MMHVSPLSYKKVVLGLGIWFLGFFGLSMAQYVWQEYCNKGDLMQQAFCMANRKGVIIDAGTNSYDVGQEVFFGSHHIDISGSLFKFKMKFGISHQDSIVVRVTRFILMMTIVLAVTMIILNGMQYIIKSGSGEDPSKIRNNLVYIVVGIIIALFSVVLINLLRSTGYTLYNSVSMRSSLMEKSSLV